MPCPLYCRGKGPFVLLAAYNSKASLFDGMWGALVLRT